MASSENEYTFYHMKCINFFKWTCLGRTVIRGNSSTGYTIKPAPILSQFVFFLYFFNTFAKLTFLSFLITGHLGPTEFLDTIGGVDYFLCGIMVCISYIIWQRYPIYEIIYRLWEIENRIYVRLGRPREIKWEAEEKHSITLWAHAILTGVGCCSLTLQFYEAPKYCVFTYSITEADNAFLRVLFCFHECLFLSHAWFAMSCGNGLCSFEAVNLSLIIKQMTKTVNELSEDTVLYQDESYVSHANVVRAGESEQDSSTAFRFNDHPTSTANESEMPTEKALHPANPRRLLWSTRRTQLSSGVSKTYNIRRILYDFQQLILVSEQFNAWIGYKIVALSICGFCQYISSTTMAFQVIKLPGTGIGDIWFYIQDCTVAVYVTFRVFDYMSIVLPASQEFLQSVKKYMASKAVTGGHLRKFQRTLRPVSLKVGPNPLRREAVLETMEMLASYYVCVALW